ncbi:transporter [Pseudomonas sp. NBRC 100443]|uniref:SphA family protein n=1 Tax=Pseudomonas sp. NBRC 100443 TaxID=1113665 RepID=UPI0024A2A575|nr:transporter [Pseudomonas sp. NBRC 100443]GLU39282.1 phenol degradation protein [Pseudomonas sp. NBRC 100443]
MKITDALRVAVCSIGVLLASRAYALEGGTSSYPSGTLTVMNGAVGAPGETHFYTYNKLISIDSLRNNDGDKSFPKVKGKIHAHAIRVVHTLDGPKLLGGDVSLQAGLPYVSGHINIPALGPYERDSVSGISDPMFGFLVSWVSATYLHNIDIEWIEPWGKYDKNSLINSGNNARALYMGYSFTWFPMERVELSSKISLNYSFENKDTDYQSGVQLVADYGLNYRVTQNWFAGVGGYISTQLNDDQSHGDDVGNRSRSTKIGPQFGYGTRDWGFVAGYQNDVYARNTSKGDTILLNAFMKY